ncbi:DNA-binding response regulator [Alteromonas sp. 38]|uniref:LytR/AlgR family response regulator transcription factor n=1 Tax=Alteromonas TaxID=226 RepID=UPI0012F12C0F|nr:MULTISPECIES: LytTR family DNA-binding domain-containing protein [Alteromonas]CAD5249656.1 DNA-binding response regulator [Alteromonas sp. 154]VXC44475.1 DNA-binding response regulator [Alteromonas sp. 38]
MFNVLVADDERLARETIKLLLANAPGVGNIWEASDGRQAIELGKLHSPDLVFLDVEMPISNGIEVARELPSNSIIVFVTAFNDYAVTAFELNAIDYILKPFDDERFEKTLSKVKQKFLEGSRSNFSQIGEVIKEIIDNKNSYRQRLVIRDPGRIRLVDVDCILYINGAGNYAELHLEDGNIVLHRETLTILEEQLNPDDFIRIHRSTIVKRHAISELRPNEKGDYSVILNSGDTLTLSRRNRTKLEELTGE